MIKTSVEATHAWHRWPDEKPETIGRKEVIRSNGARASFWYGLNGFATHTGQQISDVSAWMEIDSTPQFG